MQSVDYTQPWPEYLYSLFRSNWTSARILLHKMIKWIWFVYNSMQNVLDFSLKKLLCNRLLYKFNSKNFTFCLTHTVSIGQGKTDLNYRFQMRIYFFFSLLSG